MHTLMSHYLRTACNVFYSAFSYKDVVRYQGSGKTRMLFDQKYYIHNGTLHFIIGPLIKYNHVKQLGYFAQ